MRLRKAVAIARTPRRDCYRLGTAENLACVTPVTMLRPLRVPTVRRQPNQSEHGSVSLPRRAKSSQGGDRNAWWRPTAFQDSSESLELVGSRPRHEHPVGGDSGLATAEPVR